MSEARSAASPAPSVGLDVDRMRRLYRALLLPRLIEEKALLLLRQGRLSKWFSGMGQEAIAVGVTFALEADDWILPMHRNLGVFTTRGVDLGRLFRQLFGKDGGFTKGRDRTFHFGLRESRIVGMISHLGATVPVADGLALAAQLRGERRVAATFSGDGGTSEGDFHEAVNLAAVWKLPVLFVVENNQYGLSTPVSEQYACADLADRGIGYGIPGVVVDGNDVLAVVEAVGRAAARARGGDGPTLLEFKTFRMRGHEEASGTAYVPPQLFEQWARKDPVARFEQWLIARGLLDDAARERLRAELKPMIDSLVDEALAAPDPVSSAEAELADVYAPSAVTASAPSADAPSSELRYVDAIKDGLREVMRRRPEALLIGQDIAEYGGVFKATEGFVAEFGKARVRNTPIIESGALGAALGLALDGFRPMVEMQFGDFITCGFNQIVNNLAKTHYRWGAAAPVVVRAPIGGGTGAGPFHSQNVEAWFTQVPGLKVVAPATPYDAKGLLTSAFEDGNPVLYLEHKLLYRSARERVPAGWYTLPLGQARVAREGTDATIVTYSVGVVWALDAAQRLATEGIEVEVIDLRTLLPWDRETVLASVGRTSRVLVLHEAPVSGGFGAEVAAVIGREAFGALDAPVFRLGALDTPVPFSKALEEVFSPARGSCPRSASCWPTDLTPAAIAAVALSGLALGVVLLLRQRWGWRGLLAVRRRFPARIERYKHAGKPRIRAALLVDPEVAAAVAAHTVETGDSVEAAWAKVHAYVDEIVPSFNLLAYYRLGYGLARLLLPLLYKVSVGHEPRAALNAIPRDSVVVYLMNHRSNADYVLVAYVLSGRVAVSYAVGEWARVWPLETLFKSFGSYFVRRRYKEALYHKVLERYVQLITRNGVTQGVFIEGGLSRDGSFRPPKLGLLDYLARVKLDPSFTRPVFFVPVAINYDRVLEDRSLLREGQAPEARLRRRDQLAEVATYVLKVCARFLLRRARRYGRASVNFAEPISLDDWLARHPGVLALPREERLARLSGLAREVMDQIGAVMPVTAVAMACTALLQDGCESISRESWEARLGDLRSLLREAEAHMVGGDRSSAEVLDRALVMLTLRHVVRPQAGSFRVDRAQEPLDAVLRELHRALPSGRGAGRAMTGPRPADEHVEAFAMADGVTLRGTRLGAGHRRVILVSPGIFLHRESVEHRLLARRLAAVADVVTLDIRGHGDSGGAFSWGVREPEDVAAVAAALRGRYDRVGGLGFSFGGHHVGMAAALHRPFDAVALVAAPRNLFLLDHNFFTTGLLRSLPLILRRQRRRTRVAVSLRPPAALSRMVDRIAPTPLLLAHGAADWLIPPAHARALYARAGEPKSLLMIDRALHAENILVDEPEPLLAPLLAFFDRCL